MAIGSIEYAESNLSGFLDGSISKTDDTVLCRITDRVTGLPRAPQSTTKLWVMDKGTEAYPNRKYELMLVGSVSTDVNNVTTLSSCVRGLPFFGTDLTSTGIAYDHVAGAEIGVADSHLFWNLFAAILDGTYSIPQLKLGNRPIFELAGLLGFRMFANETARDAAIAVPQNGDTCFLINTGLPQWYGGGSWNDFASGSTPNASETVAGKAQQATLAQQIAKSQFGSTGAPNFVNPKNTAITSADAAEGKLVQLNSSNKIDSTLVDLSTLAPSTNSIAALAGIAIDGSTTPQLVYISDGSGGRTAGSFYGADADDTTNISFNSIGFINVNASSIGTSYNILTGVINGFSGLTLGALYYSSTTAGAITASPTVSNQKAIGIALSATALWTFPSRSYPQYGGGLANTITISGTSVVTIYTGFKAKAISFNLFIAAEDSSGGNGNSTIINGNFNAATYLGSDLEFHGTTAAQIAGLTTAPSVRPTAGTNQSSITMSVAFNADTVVITFTNDIVAGTGSANTFYNIAVTAYPY